MPQRRTVIHSDPEILGGTPVFVGTRVPVKALLDYLEGGHRLDDFLDDFPTVTREQAVAVLEEGVQLSGPDCTLHPTAAPILCARTFVTKH